MIIQWLSLSVYLFFYQSVSVYLPTPLWTPPLCPFLYITSIFSSTAGRPLFLLLSLSPSKKPPQPPTCPHFYSEFPYFSYPHVLPPACFLFISILVFLRFYYVFFATYLIILCFTGFCFIFIPPPSKSSSVLDFVSRFIIFLLFLFFTFLFFSFFFIASYPVCILGLFNGGNFQRPANQSLFQGHSV